MSDANEPVPSLRARAEEIFARSTMNSDERELWLLLFEASEQAVAEVREFRAAIDQAIARITGYPDASAARPQLKFVPLLGESHAGAE